MPPRPTSLLRLTQTAEGPDRYRVEIALEEKNLPRKIETAHFDFKLSRQDQSDLRWYLETYLQYPLDPNPKLAAGVEQRMIAIGADLFRAVFHFNDGTRNLWARISDRLNDTRIEIVTEAASAGAIPWELLHDPWTNTPLALHARAFVYALPQSGRPARPPSAAGPIRILLVICRPDRDDDVPFRSVASRLIKGLNDEARAAFQLDVLRPPTFEQLSEVLRDAHAAGQPYHVVHFDGHGVYGEPAKITVRKSRDQYVDSRPGRHGYLVFENPNPSAPDNLELVDGPTLGRLLAETAVPVLVLNACRSAHADEPTTDDRRPTTDQEQRTENKEQTAENRDPAASISNLQSPISNPPEQVRAFGSLAQEVMDAGVAGVVAMRYNVYVVTAAQFVADIYEALAGGQTLGAAEWKRLVDEIVPDFVDPTNDGPLPEREEEWSVVTQYRVWLVREARQWTEAERLQLASVEWDRRRATAARAISPEVLDGIQRNIIRTLAASLHDLGQIQRELGRLECVTSYEESLHLAEQIEEKAGAASCAFNLGTAYIDISTLRDLAQAEHWYRRSLELRDEHDRQGRAQCLGQLGYVMHERFLEARAANKPEEELLGHLNNAAQFYHQTLNLLPANAVNDLAVTHNQLGLIYNGAGHINRAQSHWSEAIRYLEGAGNLYGAARARFNIAVTLARSGRLPEALLYAQAALRNFATYGDGAAAEIQRTQELIADIEQLMQERAG